MMSNEFEAQFSVFLEHSSYDSAEQALFAVVRAVFLAGWLAAGGTPPQDVRMFQVLHGNGDS